jgi:hypothetical protein
MLTSYEVRKSEVRTPITVIFSISIRAIISFMLMDIEAHRIINISIVPNTQLFRLPINPKKNASYKGAQINFMHQGYSIALSIANYEFVAP